MQRGNMMRKMDLKLFEKERDEAALSFDLDTFKKFYEKWTERGMYCLQLPGDHVLEITMRKMVLLMKNPPEDKIQEAKKWLIDHGYRTDVK